MRRISAGMIAAMALFVCAALFIACIPFQIRLIASYADELSPRFFPYACALALAFFSLASLVAEKKCPDPPLPLSPAEKKQTLGVVLMVGLAAALAPGLGLSLATTLLVLCLALFFGERKLLALLILALTWPLFIYLLFDVAFSTPLPPGRWFV